MQGRKYQPGHWQACGQACGVRGLQGAPIRRRSRPRQHVAQPPLPFAHGDHGGRGGQAARTDSVGVGSSPHQCLVLQQYGASQQPGSLFEKTLHETAVSWIRCGLTWTLPPRLWEGAPTELARRLGAVAEDINMCHSVEGLCRGLPPACLGLARCPWVVGWISERALDSPQCVQSILWKRGSCKQSNILPKYPES